MSVLILNRASLQANPYHAWLAGYAGDVVLITSAEKLASFGESVADVERRYARVHVVRDYDVAGTVEYLALQEHREHAFEHVVALAEFDLERAARIRRRLGLPGQPLESARVFRDKLRMKERAAAGGIPVARGAAVTSVLDVLAFTRRHGFPVVLKPRNGAASVDLAILRSAAGLRGFETGGAMAESGVAANLMIEEFVSGSMYHVDGLRLGGDLKLVWPSKYHGDNAAYHDNSALGSCMLDAGNPLTPRLQRFAVACLDAFPSPGDMTFHIEVFHTPDDRIVLCEIAGRTGGARISETIAHAFGVNVNEALVRAQNGLPLAAAATLSWEERQPPRSSGWLLPSPRRGTIRRIPAACDLAGVVDYRRLKSVGQALGDKASAVDAVASFVIEADDESAWLARSAEVQRWFDAGFEVVPEPPAGAAQLPTTTTV